MARREINAREKEQFEQADTLVAEKNDNIINVLNTNDELRKAIGYSAQEWNNLPDGQKSMVLKQLQDKNPNLYKKLVNQVSPAENKTNAFSLPSGVNFKF